MPSINQSRRLGSKAFIRRATAPQTSHCRGQIPVDPEIVVDGPCLNKYLDSLEGLSGQ
jgi:hypothetical protein